MKPSSSVANFANGTQQEGGADGPLWGREGGDVTPKGKGTKKGKGGANLVEDDSDNKFDKGNDRMFLGKGSQKKGSSKVTNAFGINRSQRKSRHHAKHSKDELEEEYKKPHYEKQESGATKNKKKKLDDDIEDLDKEDSQSRNDGEDDKEAAAKLKVDQIQKAKLDAILNKEREVIL